MARYKESGGWARVAEHVGGGVTIDECKSRRNNYLGQKMGGVNKEKWNETEVICFETFLEFAQTQ